MIPLLLPRNESEMEEDALIRASRQQRPIVGLRSEPDRIADWTRWCEAFGHSTEAARQIAIEENERLRT